MSKPVQVIAASDYPQMLSRQDATRALETLRSAQTLARADAAAEHVAPALREAILAYVAQMEECSGDFALVFDKVHEIRGLAENAGLVTTGRIAETLCRYMDDMTRIAKPLDPTIVVLHVAAISRAAHAERDDAAMGETVAAELAALVTRRLTGGK